MNRLRQFWSNLRSSFWFVPALIVAASIGVALALIEVDSSGGKQWLAGWPRLFGVGAEGARGILSTIAGFAFSIGGSFHIRLTLMAITTPRPCLINRMPYHAGSGEQCNKAFLAGRLDK